MFRTLERNPFYMVNEKGEIYSVRKNKVLIPKTNHDGYLRIQLWNHGKCEFVSIHRLVAEAFIPNPDNLSVVNHIDGNKQNNNFENLEWCTQQENIKHAWRNGLSKSQLNGKLSKPVLQLDKEENIIKEFPSIMEVERKLGIFHTNISYACRHGIKAGGYYWKYAETCND